MTLRDLKRRLDYWLTVLDAPEWRDRITVRWGSKREMGENEGLCIWTAEYPVADIALRRGQADPESTLIHEIVHILLEGHRSEPAEYSPLYERGINRISEGLVALAKERT